MAEYYEAGKLKSVIKSSISTVELLFSLLMNLLETKMAKTAKTVKFRFKERSRIICSFNFVFLLSSDYYL